MQSQNEKCPVCDVSVKASELAVHVNACLDKQTITIPLEKAKPPPPAHSAEVQKLLGGLVPPAGMNESVLVDLSAEARVAPTAANNQQFIKELLGLVQPDQQSKLPDLDIAGNTPNTAATTPKPTPSMTATITLAQAAAMATSPATASTASPVASTAPVVAAPTTTTAPTAAAASPTTAAPTAAAAAKAPVVVPAAPVPTPVPAAPVHHKILLVDEPDEKERPLKLSGSEDPEVQARLLAELERRRVTEAEDRRLALQLAHDLALQEDRLRAARDAEAKRLNREEERLRRQQQEQEALRLAQRLHEDELRRKREADQRLSEDERLARQLSEDDRRRDEDRRRQIEQDRAIAVARQQAKAEMDAEIARLLKEKEDLEASLQNMQNPYHEVNEGTIVLHGVEYPSYWQAQVNNCQQFEVQAWTEEYTRITSKFLETIPHAHIRSVQRVQNRSLWMWYFLKKKDIAAKNRGGHNERYLFHGSRTNAVDTICQQGFDHRVSNLQGALGAGIYFATNANTSAGFVNHHHAQRRRMICCRVALGSVGQGSVGLRRPPARGGNGLLFDSVGGNGMFVTFDNMQAYPEYIITYD